MNSKQTNKFVWSAVVAGALLGIFMGKLASQYNPANLGNGWYPNLPAVSEVQLNWAIGCLESNGAPKNPTLMAGETTRLSGDLGRTPTMIIWQKDGWQFWTDAVQTYYHPQVAYVEIAQAFGLPVKWITCSSAAPTIITAVPSPLGAPWPEQCIGCYRSNLDDKFLVGQTFTDASGTYLKRSGGWFFNTYSYWVKQ